MATQEELNKLSLNKIDKPIISEGIIGHHARALGGASLPFFDRYLLNHNVLFKKTA